MFTENLVVLRNDRVDRSIDHTQVHTHTQLKGRVATVVKSCHPYNYFFLLLPFMLLFQ